jgi:RNA polymerase sigma factor (sigma-70 family)
MPTESGKPLLTFIRRLAVSHYHRELTDAELLQRFAVQREETAFTALMHRHGPMVLGVCQSILQDTHDAEDAFQATFLVLVRKAKGIGKPASVASWLHGVAYRLSMKARVEVARRRACERKVVTMPAREPQDEVIWRDLRPALHEEVARLPERYRLPFVLCYLEGKTNAEAADLLGWPKGTVLSSLSRARERLRAGLTRRGVALTSSVVAALLAQSAARAAVPAARAESTLQAALLLTTGAGATGAIAAPVVAYAETMLHATFVAKLRLAAATLLAVSLMGTGAGAFIYHVRTTALDETISGEPPQVRVSQGDPKAAVGAPPLLVQDKERLQGTWMIVSAELNGQGTEALNGRRLLFAGDHFTPSAGTGLRGLIPSDPWAGDFTLVPGRPAQIELNPNSGSKRIEFVHKIVRKTGTARTEFSQTIRQPTAHLQGNYSLEGETLKIHLSDAGEERSGKGLLLTLMRE